VAHDLGCNIDEAAAAGNATPTVKS
jgi:hypothetical protein